MKYAANNNIVLDHARKTWSEKEKNAGYQYSFLFPQSFLKASFSGFLSLKIVWKRVNTLPNEKILHLLKLKAFADDKINLN